MLIRLTIGRSESIAQKGYWCWLAVPRADRCADRKLSSGRRSANRGQSPKRAICADSPFLPRTWFFGQHKCPSERAFLPPTTYGTYSDRTCILLHGPPPCWVLGLLISVYPKTGSVAPSMIYTPKTGSAGRPMIMGLLRTSPRGAGHALPTPEHPSLDCGVRPDSLFGAGNTPLLRSTPVAPQHCGRFFHLRRHKCIQSFSNASSADIAV